MARPYFATLKADPAFNMLAIPLRFAALRELVELEHPDRARSMREWSPEAQSSTLKWLDSSTKEKIRCHRAGTLDHDQGHEGMRCVARYLPIGIDLQLMEADDFRRTELHKDADLAEVRAMRWRQALEERGWK